MQIISRKLTSEEFRKWDAARLDETDDFLILYGIFAREIRHRHLGKIPRGTPCLEFFSKYQPFTIFLFYSTDFSARRFYCNLNTLPRFTENHLEFFDLEIDVLVDENHNLQFLDMEDFIRMKQTSQIGVANTNFVSAGLKALLKLYFERQFPFDGFAIREMLEISAAGIDCKR